MLRMVMGGIALLAAWQLVRAWVSGTIVNEDWSATLDENPASYAIGMVVQAGIVAFCTYLALGYPMPAFLVAFSGI